MVAGMAPASVAAMDRLLASAKAFVIVQGTDPATDWKEEFATVPATAHAKVLMTGRQ